VAENQQKESASRTHDSHGVSTRVYEENNVDHAALRAKIGDLITDIRTEFKQTVIYTSRENVTKALEIVKSDPELGFNMLTDITAVDNIRRPDFDPGQRFTLIHTVYSLANKKRIRFECRLPESDPRAPSACNVYKGAAWLEREVYDMFGITFDGHPDLRRVLMPDYYEHFPLRKDYPLTGRGERDNFVRAEEIA
jgi:NADH/F420H2 dehydrogenase subunit C